MTAADVQGWLQPGLQGLSILSSSLIGYLIWRRTGATNDKVVAIGDKVEVVRHATNSLTERLVDTTRVAEFARGHLAGNAEAIATIAAAAAAPIIEGKLA